MHDQPSLIQPAIEPRDPSTRQIPVARGLRFEPGTRRACAVAGEHSLPALETAHIRPCAEGGEHRVSNGLLLSSDIHRLFDQCYVTVTPERRFEVSRRLNEDFDNGRSYYPLNGQLIIPPHDRQDWPDRRALEWHNCERFLG